MKLTTNFTLEELTASATAWRKGIDNTPSDIVKTKLKILCESLLQPIRHEWGAPIIVSSGYRCERLNKAVGGVDNSDHLYGCAADIHTLSDHPTENRMLFETIVGLYHAGHLPMLKQCIDEYNYNWLHISWQDGRTQKKGQFLHIR